MEIWCAFICKNVLGTQHKENTLAEPKEGTLQLSLTCSVSQATPLEKIRISLKYILFVEKTASLASKKRQITLSEVKLEACGSPRLIRENQSIC